MTSDQFPGHHILIDYGLYLYFTVISYLGPPLLGPQGKLIPPPLWATCTAPAVTTIYDSIVS
jgi:hypothetical protein